jgi:hypothetical protein
VDSGRIARIILLLLLLVFFVNVIKGTGTQWLRAKFLGKP